jgi:hypothetical protein
MFVNASFCLKLWRALVTRDGFSFSCDQLEGAWDFADWYVVTVSRLGLMGDNLSELFVDDMLEFRLTLTLQLAHSALICFISCTAICLPSCLIIVRPLNLNVLKFSSRKKTVLQTPSKYPS